MSCCYSCFYWDKASKKVPINVKKIPKPKETIEIEFKGKAIRMPAWEWKLEKPMKLSEIKSLRLCFYGKGRIQPWDSCKNYKPKFPESLLACQIKHIGCPFMNACSRHRPLDYVV